MKFQSFGSQMNRKFYPTMILLTYYPDSVPFLALARTFCEIQKTRARLVQIDLLRDFLLCVIVQNSDDLLPSVSLASNQVQKSSYCTLFFFDIFRV